MADKKEDAKSLLAADLAQGHVTRFLTFQNIAAKILAIPGKGLKPSFVAGLKFLVGLHGLAKVIGPFYARWHGQGADNLTLFEEALRGFPPFVEKMFERIPHDDVLAAFEELVSTEDSDGHPVTWDNFAHAFPYRELAACVRESREEAAKAAGEDADAPEDEVVDEEIMEVEPPVPSRPDGPDGTVDG